MSLLAGNAEVDFVFFGDAMQHSKQYEVARRADGTYDYSACFKHVQSDIEEADYAVVNLECSLGGAPYSGYPCFSAPDEYAKQLQTVGFDLFLTANNHCLDRRDKGAVRTINKLDEWGIPHIGTYINKADRAKRLPCIKDFDGIKVDAARAAGANVLCVNMHWGIEYTLTPVKEQKDLADFLIDKGVDLIIGGHPHVVEPFEVRHSDKYNKDILLVYSLGNFISNMSDIDCRGGAMVKVKVKMKDGKPVIDSPRYKLFFCQKPGAGDNTYQVIPEDKPELVRADSRETFKRFMQRTHDLVMSKNVNVPQDE